MRTLLLAVAVSVSLSSLVQAQAVSRPPDASATTAVQRATADKTTPAVSFGSEGLLFSTADESTQLRVHGYVQADNRMFNNNLHNEPLDTFLFRRIRPLFEGTLFNEVDFRFMPDFGQNNPQVQEAYLELKTIRFAKLRVGKFKEPVGLEALRSDRELTFSERSLVSDLVPLRYMGAQVGGAMLSDSISYEVGYFNGANDGSNGNFQWLRANEGAARLFLRPFAATRISALKQFGIGAAGSAGDQHGVNSGLKTVGQSTFFKYSSTALANGQHNRVSPQAYYYFGPVGVLSEYAISSQDVLNKKLTRRIRNQGWEVQGSVVVTGEKNTYNGVRPRHAFEPNKGLRHLGALELGVRYSKLQIDGDAFPLFANPKTAAQQAAERGFVVNWYLNRYTKLVTNFEHTKFRMASSAVAPLHSENVLISRLQLAF